MKFNLVVEIDEADIAEYLTDCPTASRQDLKKELNNACYLGLGCIEAIVLRQFGFGVGDSYVEKSGEL